MTNPFEHTSAHWVRYSDYEWRKAHDGNVYLMPISGAKPAVYDPNHRSFPHAENDTELWARMKNFYDSILKSDEKMIPNGLQFPKSATAIESKPQLVSTPG